ncbi:hypothetical protein OUQ99_14460 [Streptomonospora nanhaiensis]|uniref:Uncharacterized protein n=1 Tax=Streptomonospora nanhaiensis TaxID=1323731 RepID=A0ABY6YVT1_9ACTN|nr:hypothetical protein [Streptomonospora nanhaiensis]WAE76206.1 hypothetical protein OUQ99_14460 [Streptomonospora nanhaiensis]
MLAPPAPLLVFTSTAKGSGPGVGSRSPGEPRETGEPERTEPAPDKDED